VLKEDKVFPSVEEVYDPGAMSRGAGRIGIEGREL